MARPGSDSEPKRASSESLTLPLTTSWATLRVLSMQIARPTSRHALGTFLSLTFSSWAIVRSLTTPVWGRKNLPWNRVTAATVGLSYLPVAFTRTPAQVRRCWVFFTSGPNAPLATGRDRAAPAVTATGAEVEGAYEAGVFGVKRAEYECEPGPGRRPP